MTRYRMELDFSIPGFELEPGDRAEIRDFIRDALETWGGQRHPEDWLFHSLNVHRMGAIKEIPKCPKNASQSKS